MRQKFEEEEEDLLTRSNTDLLWGKEQLSVPSKGLQESVFKPNSTQSPESLPVTKRLNPNSVFWGESMVIQSQAQCLLPREFSKKQSFVVGF